MIILRSSFTYPRCWTLCFSRLIFFPFLVYSLLSVENMFEQFSGKEFMGSKHFITSFLKIHILSSHLIDSLAEYKILD